MALLEHCPTIWGGGGGAGGGCVVYGYPFWSCDFLREMNRQPARKSRGSDSVFDQKGFRAKYVGQVLQGFAEPQVQRARDSGGARFQERSRGPCFRFPLNPRSFHLFKDMFSLVGLKGNLSLCWKCVYFFQDLINSRLSQCLCHVYPGFVLVTCRDRSGNWMHSLLSIWVF